MGETFEILASGFSGALLFSVILGFVAYMRYLRYKETVELARRGLIRPKYTRGRSNRTRSGFITAAVGGALTLGLLTIGWGPWLIPGFIPLFVGLALIFTSSGEDETVQTPDHDPIFDDFDDDPIPEHKK